MIPYFLQKVYNKFASDTKGSDIMTKTFKTVNGEILMNTYIPPMEFVVESFITQGLHILSGSPKIGKSWLALMLCLKVAKSEKLWNYETKQGDVLYLCLYIIFESKKMMTR